MAIIVGGHTGGLLDSSLFLLNRGDSTGSNPGGGESVYVNIANGNLVIQQQDAFLPSRGDDYLLLRTYNSRGVYTDAHEHDGSRWTLSTSVRITKQHDSTGAYFKVEYGDGSRFEYRFDAVTGLYVSTDGAGPYETIEDLPGNGGRGPAYVLTRGDQSRLTFSHQGELLSWEDTNGVRMTYEYEADRLVRVYDDDGHVISYTYENGVLQQVQDETGAVLVRYGYQQGQLVEVTDRHGHTTRYVYNNTGQIERIILPSEQWVDGELKRYDNREISFTYQEVTWPWAGSGRGYVISSMTDAEGNVTSFEYDLVLGQNQAPDKGKGKGNDKGKTPGGDPFFHGGSTRVVDALGNKRAYSNEAEYRAWRVANGYYEYYQDGPSAGNPHFQAQVEAIRAAHSVTYFYNSYSYLTAVVDQEGFHTSYSYDDRNNLVAVTDRNGWGAVNSDSAYYRNLRASLGYTDASGQGKRVAQLTNAEREALLAAFTSRFEYDERGNLVASYDNSGNLTTRTYTSFNKIASQTSAVGHALVTSNDAYYRELRQELGYAADVGELSALERQALLERYTTRYEYDERQNLVRQIGAAGGTTEYEYDVYGNMVRRVVYLDAADRSDPAKQQVTRYFYDQFGNNIETVDAEGNRTFREYDHFGNLIRFIDGNGGVTTYTYDADNRLLTVTDPLGNTSFNTYDAVGNRISITDANGHTVTQIYDRNNQLIATIDPSATDPSRDRITRYSYDVVGNRTAVQDAEGREIRYVYNARRELIELQLPAVEGAQGGLVTYSSTYAYDGEGNRITVTDNNGNRTDYLYDRNGLTRQVTDPLGHVTAFRYDANLNQIQIIAGMQLAPELRRILHFRYDEEDRLIAEISGEGSITQHRYDVAGNRVALIDPNGEAIVRSDDAYYRDLRRDLGLVDGHGNGLLVAELTAADIDMLRARFTTDFEYDGNNRLIREIRPAAVDGRSGEEIRHVVEHRYDGNGNRIETIDENGHSTIVTYDANDRAVMLEDTNGIKTVFRYDSRGNRTAVYIGVQAHVDADGRVVIDDAAAAQATNYVYDEFNQLIAKTDGLGNALASSDSKLYQDLRAEMGYGRLTAELSGSDKAALRGAYTERYSYDRVGNLLNVVDHLGRESSARYDSLNRLIEQTDTAGQVTSFRYDGNGNRVAVTEVMGHALVSSNDAIYREQRLALGYAADVADLTALERAALLERYTAHYAYDGNDRLLRVTSHQDVVTARDYDSFGNLIAETRAAGTADARRTEYLYDLDNRLLAEITDPAGLAITQRLEYDAVGNRIRVVDGRGHGTRYVYDARDRLIKVIDPLGFETRYEYDGVGNQLAIVDARGGITRFEYDPGNRQISLTDAEGRVTEYAYDVRNNRIEQRTAAGTPDEQLTRFEYDTENHLRAVVDAEGNRSEHTYDRIYNRTSTTDGNGNVTTYAFDALDRLIEHTDPEGGRTTYRYDAAGNRLSITSANGHAAVDSDAPAYLELRRRLGYVDSAGQALTAAALTAEQREALLAAFTTRYEYDNEHRLIREIDHHGVATEYRYDAVGYRTDIVRAAGSDEAQHSRYLYDKAGRLVATVDAIGIGLAESDSAEYRPMRASLGYPEALAKLTAEQQEALRGLHTTRSVYDANGNMVRSVDALGRITEYVYDANNRVVAIIDPLGVGLAESDSTSYREARLALGYPADAALLTETQLAALKARHTTQYVYDETGNRVQVIDALGHATTTYYNLNSEVVLVVDPEGGATSYAYDGNGNRVRMTRHAVPFTQPVDPAQQPLPLASPDDQVNRYAYDGLNRQVRSLDGEGYLVETRYDAVGNVLERRAYANPVDDIAATPASDGRDRVTSFSYDANGRLIGQVDAEGYVRSYGYDAVGNRLFDALDMGDGSQQVTRFVYDNMNRLISRFDNLGLETRYSYDAVGNRTRTVEAAGTELERIWQYRYDDGNRVVAETNPEGTVTRYVYDAAGQRIARYQADGLPEQRLTTYAFDGNGRLVREERPDGTATVSRYDAVGNLVERLDAAGSAAERRVSFVYDRNNRLVAQTLGAGTAAATTIAYEYDAFGNRVAEIRGAGSQDVRRTEYVYDRNDRLIARLQGNGALTTYGFDAFGNVVEETTYDRASGRTQTVRLSYDGRDLLLTRENGEGEILRRVYDAAGNVRLQVQADGSPDAVATHYDYDAGNRLVRKVLDPNGLALTTEYAYDLHGNLIAETSPNAFAATASDAAYYGALREQLGIVGADKLGKAVAELTADDIAKLRAAFTTVTEYDLMGRAVAVTDGTGYSTVFDYDLFGNQISITTGAYLPQPGEPGYDAALAALAKPATSRFAYDAGNRQILQVDAMGVVTKFEYDARGNRITQIGAYAYLDAALPLDEANFAVLDQQRNGLAPTQARVHAYSYDAADRLQEERQPAGTLIRYAYTGAGELAAKTVDYGSGAGYKNATTRYFYNDAGQLEFEVDPVGSVTHYAYDDFGNQIRVTRGLGLDAQGRPSMAATPDRRVIEQRYDLANRLLAEIIDPQGLALTTAYEYDARGNRTAIIDANGHRGEVVYDAGDRVVWQRDGEGYVVTFGRDAQGNKIIETWHAAAAAELALGASPAPAEHDRQVSYVYDRLNRLVERTDAQGIVNRLVYDAAGNVVREVENATGLHGAEPRITEYDYNLANLVIEQRELVHPETGEVRGLITRFSYDGAYNTVEKTQLNRWLDTLPAGGPFERLREETTRYGYDLNNRLIDQIVDPDGLALRTSYRYDGLGNRIAEVSPNGYAALAAAGSHRLSSQVQTEILAGYTTRNYYDAAGRPRFTVDPLGRVREVRYDAVGNIVTAIQYSTVLDADELAVLDDYTLPAIVAGALDRTVGYSYDKADRQIGTLFDATELWVPDGSSGYRAETKAAATSKAYDGVGNVVSETDGNGNTTYFYYDSRGLKIGEINAENYLTLYSYDAFGNLLSESLYLDRQELSASVKRGLDVGQYVPTGPARAIEYQYDNGNNQLRTIYPPSSLYENSTMREVALQVERTFDAFGNVLTETVLHAQDDGEPAYQQFEYDVGGRLIRSVDARASQLLQRDDPYLMALRGGKTVAQLTEADRAAIVESYATHLRYDAAGRLLEQQEGERVTHFVYDAAGRTTEVHLPAVAWTEVDQHGNVLVGDTLYRPVSTTAYDANGNLLAETKANGEVIRYRYDAADQMVGSVDPNGICTTYEYNFAGDRIRIHRHWRPVTSADHPLAGTDLERDQIIEFEYDRLGRLTAEIQRGDSSTGGDRVIRFGYDANGNQARIVGARGYISQMFYDGLDRLIGTVNPSGGLTFTSYDALNNVIGRQAGGWHAPRLIDNVINHVQVSSEGVTLEWRTDHATDGIVQVRRAGSTDEWQSFGLEGDYGLDHSLEIAGLAADTLYEYRLAISDAFGYRLTTSTHTFRTAQATQGVTVFGLQAADSGYQADIAFALPSGARDVSVIVGSLSGDRLNLADATSFTPIREADGSYRATVRFADTQAALYQIRWTDGAGVAHVTAPEAIQQQQALHRFDGQVTATPTNDSGIYDVTVYWSLPLDQVGSYTEAEIDPDTGESRDVRGYTAYVGYQRLDEFGEGEEPEYEELSLGPDGRLSFTFERLLEGPYSLHFFYVDPDDGIVRGPAIEVEGLANTDRQYQRLYLQFPDLSADAPVEQSSFFYRPQGSTDDWLELPASAVHGLAIDVLGLPEGDYEFRAPVKVDGEERISYGSFRLREPASVERLLQSPTVTGLVDRQQPGSAVTYSVDGGLLRFPELFPLNYGERVQFIATDLAIGQTHQLSMLLGYADLSKLPAGDYSFQLVKTRTGEEPEPLEHILNDINGNVRTYPELTYQLDDNRLTLEGLWPLNEGEQLDAVARDADGSEHVLAFGDDGQLDLTALPPGSFDLVIRKLATGQAGGVLAEFSGHVVIAPLQLLDAEIGDMAGVRSPRAYWQAAEARPQEVTVELLAGDSTASADNVHTLYDVNGRKLYSNEDGGVWTRYDYDAQGNVVREVRFKLYDASSDTFLEQIENRAERPALAELELSFAKAQEAYHQRGEDTLRIISRAYDAAGNTIRETAHSRAYGELSSEWQYDRYGNKAAETIAKGVAGEELRTTYTYDAYDRLTSVTFGPFQYFQPNAAGELTPEHGSVSQTFTYDKAGNRSTATNERGYRERFHYDAANRLVSQWDAQGEVSGGWGKSGLRTDYEYDHFGRLVLRRETDLTKPAGTADSVRTLEARYDVFDQQVWMRDALGLITTRRYDLDGNVLAETDANGHALVMAARELPEEVAEWARATRERLGFPAEVAELSEAQKAQLLAAYTEHYRYDGENQVIRRTDRLGNVWSTAYDAYGNIVSERDGNGRVTTYKIGAFGQVLSKEVRLPTVEVRSASLPAVRWDWDKGLVEYDKGSKPYTTNAGAQRYTEKTAYDWLGRSIRVTDSFGRDDEFVYDDADRLHRLTKRMVDGSQTAEYGYDLRGNRTSEKLRLNGEEIRRQTLDYNERGWLIETTTQFDLHNRSVAGETLTLQHSYDAVGNRVAQRTLHVRDDGSPSDTTHVYRFDGANRMLSAFDPKAGEQGELIDSIGYDGFGNRIQIARNGTVIDYRYDLGGRVQQAQVQGSDAIETWDYDALGNSIYHRQADGAYTRSVYDAAGRAVETVSYAKGDDGKWQTTTSRLVYDRAGNLAVTTVSANNYRFDEVTKVDVRYDAQTKSLHNSWVKKARGMTGTTRFSYDVNGQLVTLNRGSSKKNKPATVAYFRYDNDGHILSRTDQASAVSRAEYLYGYDDPQARTTQIARHAFRLGISEADAAAHMQQAELYAIENGGMWNVHGFAGGVHQANSPIELQSYVYVNGQPVADLGVTRALQFKTLAVADADRRLLGHDTYYDEWGTPYQMPRYGGVPLTAEDIVHTADGSIDREATARQLATRLYAQPQSLAAALDDLDADSWYGNRGSQSARFSDLSTATQARLVAHLADLLPADDSTIAAGTELILSKYLDLVDTSDSDVRLTSDYAYQAIGGTDGLPGGSVSRHVVREGDTLASLAQAYFGSSHYWYLLADANHLTGDEPLTAGRTLTIPNLVANSVNAHDSHALYRESEIIGATSPEVRVRPKKSSFFKKLVQVVIVIAIVVAAIWVASVLGPLVGQIAGQVAGSALGTALGTTLGTAVGYAVGIAAVAALGFAAGFATGYLTQTLAIAADLQEGYDWKGMRKMGTSFALTAVASGISEWAQALGAGQQALVQGATQAGVQLIESDGKITNVSGILMAMAPGAAGLAKAGEWGKTAEVLEKASKHKRLVGAGLSVLEASIRGSESTLNWVHFAAAAIGHGLAGNGASPGQPKLSVGLPTLGQLGEALTSLDYGAVARDALIGAGLSLVVGARFGEDAALDFFGGMVGQSLGEGFVDTLSGIQQRDARAAEAASQARYGLSLGRSPEAALTAGLAGALPEADVLLGEWAGERAERTATAAAAADAFAHGRLRDPRDGAPIDFVSKLADPALYYRGATTLSEAAVAPRLEEAFGTYGSLEPISDWEAFFIFDRPGQFLAGAARLPGNMLEAGREFGRMGNDAIGKLVYTIGNAVTGSEIDYPYTSQLGQLIAQEGLGTAALKAIGGTVHGLVSPLKAAYQGDFEALGEGVAELAAGLGAGKLLTTMGKGAGLVDDVRLLAPNATDSVAGALPNRFSGIQEASSYLQAEGVSRARRVQILQSFEADSMLVRQAGAQEYGIRYFDNVEAFADGRYLFETFPATRESLAVKSATYSTNTWNDMTHFKQWQIRPGAIVLEGRAASQGVGYPGGQVQKFILNPSRDYIEP